MPSDQSANNPELPPVETAAGETAAATSASGLTGSPRLLVMFCTYNERENLPIAVERLWSVLPDADVLVVDDNSPDGTGSWAREFSAQHPKLHLLARTGKLGLGTAIRDGIHWCLERDYDYLLNLDADLSHDPLAAPRFLEACSGEVDGKPVDVAVGSRYIPGGDFDGLSWHRQLISKALNFYATRILTLPLTDCSGSYRCYRVSILRNLTLDSLRCEGYGFLEEILVAIHRSGATFCEVPIVFETRNSGESKLTLADAWGALKVIHRLGFNRK